MIRKKIKNPLLKRKLSMPKKYKKKRRRSNQIYIFKAMKSVQHNSLSMLVKKKSWKNYLVAIKTTLLSSISCRLLIKIIK